MTALFWRRGFGSDLLRALSWHRRKFAVIAAAAAALAIVHAARPAPPATVAVVRVISPVDAGSTLLASHLAVQRVVAAVVPDKAVTRVAEAVGHRTVAGLTTGQILTTPLLLTPRTVTTPGRVLTSLRLSEPGLIDLLRPGDSVDVLATDPETAATALVAGGVRVITLPPSEPNPLGPMAEPLLLVEVDRAAAGDLAEAAATRRLTLLLR